MRNANRFFALHSAFCCAAIATAQITPVAETSHKGSLLFFPRVELRWADLNDDGDIEVDELVQDTVITLSNDGPSAVRVFMLAFNGDPEEFEDGDSCFHKGCNLFDYVGPLTQENPCYWSMASGRPGIGVPAIPLPPFSVLDHTRCGPGRPDPEGSKDRVLRGFLVVFAVNSAEQQIRWNHLTGSATIVNYRDQLASKYLPWSFRAIVGEQGAVIGKPGGLRMGKEYDFAPGKLLLEFFAEDAVLRTANEGFETAIGTTDLTLVIASLDARATSNGPLTTRLDMAVHNQNEVRFSFNAPCFTCWLHESLTSIHLVFNRTFMQTNAGKVRIDGRSSTTPCVGNQAALLGVAVEQIIYDPNGLPRLDMVSSPLVGLESEGAIIRYSPTAPEE
ncbi:MAG: hypothetical protein CHACPFDD_04034 [Phycisphaerae bacterium]|nr:hypothetical protein [Phycisphaerae bacterium]